MTLVRRIFRLSAVEWRLLLEAIALVWSARVALWMFPFDRARPWFTRSRGVLRNQPSPLRVGRFVDAAGALTPGANCLTLSLAAEALLLRRGHDACLQIGVSKSAAGALVAHAWVESGGQIVVGGEEAAGLTRLRPAGVQPCK